MACLSNREVFVILTVPHAKCSNLSCFIHDCDFAAKRMAQKISVALKSKTIKHQLLIGNINRQISDLNREEFRDTPFRLALRKLMKETRILYNVFLFDIHSFPANYEWERFPVIFLHAERNFPTWMDDLSRYLSYKIDSSIRTFFNIPPVNDIQDEAHQKGLKATLIEFNESNDIEIEQGLSCFIAEWIASYSKIF